MLHGRVGVLEEGHREIWVMRGDAMPPIPQGGSFVIGRRLEGPMDGPLKADLNGLAPHGNGALSFFTVEHGGPSSF